MQPAGRNCYATTACNPHKENQINSNIRLPLLSSISHDLESPFFVHSSVMTMALVYVCTSFGLWWGTDDSGWVYAAGRVGTASSTTTCCDSWYLLIFWRLIFAAGAMTARCEGELTNGLTDFHSIDPLSQACRRGEGFPPMAWAIRFDPEVATELWSQSPGHTALHCLGQNEAARMCWVRPTLDPFRLLHMEVHAGESRCCTRWYESLLLFCYLWGESPDWTSSEALMPLVFRLPPPQAEKSDGRVHKLLWK